MTQETIKPVLPLIENPIVAGRGANRSKKVGFGFGSKKQRQADAEDVKQELERILFEPSYCLVTDLQGYIGELAFIVNGTEGTLEAVVRAIPADNGQPEEVKP